MTRCVRAFFSIAWRLVCAAGGWCMAGLASLFLGIAQMFGWTGGACSYAADWLFSHANRIRAAGEGAAVAKGGAPGTGGA